MRRLLLRLINVFRPEQAEADLEREVAAHLALLEDEYRRRGMSEDEARLACTPAGFNYLNTVLQRFLE